MKQNHYFNTLFIFAIFMLQVGCSNNLGGVEGKVVNVLTGRPISDATIVATTASNIKEKQKHLRVSTKSNSNGEFKFKGLKGKRYRITISKNGFSAGDKSVSVPEEGTYVLDKTVQLCPIPPGGPGFYTYTDKFIKLSSRNSQLHKKGQWGFIYYDANELKDIAPISSKYLVKYKIRLNRNRMYRLFQHTSKNTFDNDAEDSGKYYSTGRRVRDVQFVQLRGEMRLGGSSRDCRHRSNDNHPDHSWCESTGTPFEHRQEELYVYDINGLPHGYYHIGGFNEIRVEKEDTSFVLNLQ